MKKITDPDFKYVPAAQTNIRKTFARARKQMEEEKAPKVEAIFRIVLPKQAAK